MRTARRAIEESAQDSAEASCVVSPPAAVATRSIVRTRSGHELELSEAAESAAAGECTRLVIRGSDGTVQLRIQLTPTGPVLQFQEAALELSVSGDLRMHARSMVLRADQHLELESGGSLRQRAETNFEASAGGRAKLMGHDVRVVAARGDVGIKANDDVSVDGERIWLNR